MNENLANEFKKTIESVKDMKIQVGGINNYLSILEGLIRADYQKQVDEAYQQGLDDAWEAARKIVLDPNEVGTSYPDLFAMFGNRSIQSVFRNYTASQVIVKLKAYEDKQKADEEIKVRDEVMVYGNRGVVTYVCGDVYTVMMYDGSCGKWVSADLRKTGKQHDIDKILEELRND